jgi:hypothetical protein
MRRANNIADLDGTSSYQSLTVLGIIDIPLRFALPRAQRDHIHAVDPTKSNAPG